MYGHGQGRRHRTLPRVQRSRPIKGHTFWPTFRGALSWMRKNQATLETAMGLLDIYPSLVQDQALDSVWEFLRPYLAHADSRKTGNGLKLLRKPSGNTTRDVGNQHHFAQDASGDTRTRKTTQPSVPLISVTLDDDFGEVQLGKFEESWIPRVFLCGDVGSRAGRGAGRSLGLTPTSLASGGELEELRERLMREFFVRMEAEGQAWGTSTTGVDAVIDSDVVVYLTVDDGGDSGAGGGNRPHNYLSLAWQYDVSVVTVRLTRSKLSDLVVDRLAKMDLRDKGSRLSLASCTSVTSIESAASLAAPSRSGPSPNLLSPSGPSLKFSSSNLSSASFLSTSLSPAPLGRESQATTATRSLLTMEDNSQRSRCHSAKDDLDGDMPGGEAAFVSHALRNALIFDCGDAEQTLLALRERIYKASSRDSPSPKPTLEHHHSSVDRHSSFSESRTPDYGRRRVFSTGHSHGKDFLKIPTTDWNSSSSSSCSEEDEPSSPMDFHSKDARVGLGTRTTQATTSGTGRRTPPKLPPLPLLPLISPTRSPPCEGSRPIHADPDSGVFSPLEKDTVYMVVRSKGGEREPKLVKWPLPPGEDVGSVCDSESDPFLDSPISFQDVDLSKEIRLDVFSPDSEFSFNF